MADNTITIALEGDVLLSQFAEVIRPFSDLVGALSAELAAEANIRWQIEDLQVGSAMVTAIGISKDEAPILKVVRGYEKVGKALEQKKPMPYSRKIAQEAQNIVSIIGDTITAVRFETAQSDITIYGANDFSHSSNWDSQRVALGTIFGRVETLSSRGKLKFTMYDSIFDKPINGYFQEGQEDIMRGIWGKHVSVTGQVTREPDRGRAVAIRHITAIDDQSQVEADYRMARGVFPWQPGDLPAEVLIRQVRDAEDN